MKIVIGIPNMGSIHTGTTGALIQMITGYKDIEFMPFMISSSLVYDARTWDDWQKCNIENCPFFNFSSEI